MEKVVDREEKRKSKKMEEIYELEIQKKKLEIEELKAQLKTKKEGNIVHEADPLPVTTLMKHYVQTINPFTYQIDMPPMYPPFGYPYPYQPYPQYQYPPYPYPYPNQQYPFPPPMRGPPPRDHKKKKHRRKKGSRSPDRDGDNDDQMLSPKGILKNSDSKNSLANVQMPTIQRAGTIKTIKSIQKQDSIKTVHDTLRQQNEAVYPRKEMEKTFMVRNRY